MVAIRPTDRRDLLIGFITLGSLMAAHALGETARDAFFLAGLSASKLPLAYLTIAGLALVVVRINTWALRRSSDKRRLLSATMVGAAVVDLVFWWWLRGDPPQGRAFVLYVWTGLFSTVTVVQFWLLIDDVVDIGKAKRIFGPVAAGGILGAFFGSFLAERLLVAFDMTPRALMLAAAGFLLVGAAAPFRWRASEAAPEPMQDSGEQSATVLEGIQSLCGHVYLRRLLLVVLVSTMALTGVDFVFKSVVSAPYEHAPNGAAELGQFFARFYLVLNLVALGGQLLLSGWVIRRVGVSRAVLLLPALLLMGGVGFLAVPSIGMAIFLKGTDGALRHSLHRTAMEVLYLPVPRELRERYKGIIDGVGQRGGQALASVIILLLLSAKPDVAWTMAGATVCIAIWLGVLSSLHKPYLHLFRQMLRTGVNKDRTRVPLDLGALESLVAALNSPHDEEVLVTLELFEEYERVALVPKLILYHPSSTVVIRALRMFSEAGDASIEPFARRLLRNPDPEVRGEALHAISALAPDTDVLEELSHDQCRIVSSTALVGLLARQKLASAPIIEKIELLAASDEEYTQIALAQAIGRHRNADLRKVLVRLTESPSPTARRAAADALREVPSAASIPALLPLLANGSTRAAARNALLAIGPNALPFLGATLADEDTPRRVRRHLPRTVHRFGTQEALEILQDQLRNEGDGAVRYQILRGMGRLIATERKLQVDAPLIEKTIQDNLQRILQLLQWRIGAKPQPGEGEFEVRYLELLDGALREKIENALVRVFRCLQMLNPEETYETYWRSLKTGNTTQRAASRELLEHALPGAFRAAVTGVLDALQTGETRPLAGVLGQPRAIPSRQEALTAMQEDRNLVLRSIAEKELANRRQHPVAAVESPPLFSPMKELVDA